MRVASVPQSHIYVRHLSHPGGFDPVTRLPDPVPADGRKVPGGWWPPLMLNPTWIEEHHNEFDVFHVHFGFDAVGPEVLADVVQELKMHDKPLVYTVHDLRNPHHLDPDAHTEQQDVLRPRRTCVDHPDSWRRRRSSNAVGGVEPWLLPHPHVLDRARIEAPRASLGCVRRRGPRQEPSRQHGSVSGAEHPGSDGGALPDAVLQINVHDEIFDADNYWFAPRAGAALLAFDRFEHVDVRVHPYFSDEELWDYLAAVSVSVLPYRFGTHSGWLEACFDLGTAVIAPSCGFYGQQHPCGVFTYTVDAFDAGSLEAAVHAEHARWQHGSAAPRADWAARRTQRVELAQAHRDLYERVLSS